MDGRWLPAVLFAISAIASTSGTDAAEELDDLRAIFPIVNDTLEHEPTGITVPWSNPSTGNSGELRVLRTYLKDDGTPCRDYIRTVETSAGTKGDFECQRPARLASLIGGGKPLLPDHQIRANRKAHVGLAPDELGNLVGESHGHETDTDCGVDQRANVCLRQ